MNQPKLLENVNKLIQINNKAVDYLCLLQNAYWELEAKIEDLAFNQIIPVFKDTKYEDFIIDKSGNSIKIFFDKLLTKFADDKYISCIEISRAMGLFNIFVTTTKGEYSGTVKVADMTYEEKLEIMGTILDFLQKGLSK